MRALSRARSVTIMDAPMTRYQCGAKPLVDAVAKYHVTSNDGNNTRKKEQVS